MHPALAAMLAVLIELAVGALFAAAVSEWRDRVTRGFLFLTYGSALVIAWLAFGLAGLAQAPASERIVIAALGVGLLLCTVLSATPLRSARLWLGALSTALGVLTLAIAGMDRPSQALGPELTTLVFLASSLALGSACVAMILGHWYLMTPDMTARPLRRLCDLLIASLVPLTVLTVWFALRGGSMPSATGAATGAGGMDSLLLWLGGGAITLFPAGVTVAARACCVDGGQRGRAIQAATGLLYVVAALILAGGLAGNAVLLAS